MGGVLEGSRSGGGVGGCSGMDDDPVTPAGRFFLQPEMQQVINCGIGFQNPPDVPAIKAELQRTFLRYQTRMSCLLVRDEHGREHWRPTPELDLDKHFILVPEEEAEQEHEQKMTNSGGGGDHGQEEEEEDDDNERYVNDYLASLTVSTPLGTDKPLWEVHVLPPRRRCCVLRMHHALGDGVSLMSLFLACCERADDPSLPVTIPGAGGGGRHHSGGGGKRTLPVGGPPRLPRWCSWMWRAVLVAWYSLLYIADFLLHSLWKKDDKTPITGGAGVELRPRRLVTTTFDLDDLKAIKRSAKATINDVFVGITSYGLARYFKLKSPREPSKDLRITGIAMVNIREQAGLQAATLLNYRIVSNTTFTFSNLVGPSEIVMFAKNPITYFRVITNSLPHAITIHMVSYNGKANVQILVAKDIIHDPEVLAKCFQEALKEMKLSTITKI